MLVNLNGVLPMAKKNKYGVGLFNTINLEYAKGVIAAAEETGSPVIIGSAEIFLGYSTLEELANMLIPMAKKATVPVVIHYDHGLTEEKVKEAIDLGFTSVMYDCSTLPYEENVAKVKEIVEYAHARGVTVEGELGHVGTIATGDESIYTDPLQAKDYVERTGVDCLAVAIGSAHGLYKSKPKLALDVLSNIANEVSVPLVLHGGSGLTDDDFRNSIANGISKVNIFTDIDVAAEKAAYEGYGENVGYTAVMNSVKEAVKQATIKKMNIFGSNKWSSL